MKSNGKSVESICVESYCETHNLEILEGVKSNYVISNNTLVAEYKNDESVIKFLNQEGKTKSVYRKGDLMLFLLEGQRAH